METFVASSIWYLLLDHIWIRHYSIKFPLHRSAFGQGIALSSSTTEPSKIFYFYDWPPHLELLCGLSVSCISSVTMLYDIHETTIHFSSAFLCSHMHFACGFGGGSGLGDTKMELLSGNTTLFSDACVSSFAFTLSSLVCMAWRPGV